MSARCFVDTNILVYAYDAVQGEKHHRASSLIEDLWRSRTGILSTQVLQEFAFTLRHKVRPPLSVDETLVRLQDYLRWEMVLNTGESVVSALRIGERHQISFWDSLIVHAAQMSHADILYTEDLNDGQVFDSVRVVNPLTIT